MANTLFGTMSRVRPVNWGKLHHEYVEKSIPHIGRKPSYLFPYIFHLYQHYDCFTGEEEGLLTIVADKVVYKLVLEVQIAETGTKYSNDPVVLEEPPVSPTSRIQKPTSPPPPPPCTKVETSREAHSRDIDLSAWDFPEAPFKQIHNELAELQTQFYRMEHITSGANQALDNCGLRNILRELAKKADRTEIKKLETVKAQLVAHVATMTQELSQKNKEIRTYHAEQAVVFSRIRELWDIWRGRQQGAPL